MAKNKKQFQDVADFSQLEQAQNKYELMLLMNPGVTEDQRTKSLNEHIALLEQKGAKVFHVMTGVKEIWPTQSKVKMLLTTLLTTSHFQKLSF